MAYLTLNIYAEIHHTEDAGKVYQAIKNIFGELEFKSDSSSITAQIEGLESLERFHYIIARDRIRSSIKRMFNRIKEEGELRFSLNRQAAYAGHVSLYHHNESALGPIQITVKGDVESFIEHVCR